MGQIKWYKRYPEDAIMGMMGLSLEERGAYNTVLDLIYMRDGNLPDDDRFIANWCGVDPRIWKRIKGRLIEAGKLHVRDGKITNTRATAEVDVALGRVVAARIAGQSSAQARAKQVANEFAENSDLASTGVETGVATPVLQNPEPRTQSEEPKGSPHTQDADHASEVIELWNAMASTVGLARCVKITPKRRTACNARIRADGMDAVRAAIEKIPKSSFLTGATSRDGWQADVDFFLRPDTITKILEGKYDDRTSNRPNHAGPVDHEHEALRRRIEAGRAAQSSGAVG